MNRPHQRIGSVSNAHVGADFERVALDFFAAQGIQLTRNFRTQLLKAAGRGVRIQVVAETPDQSGGKLSGSEITAYSRYPGSNYTRGPSSHPKVGLGVASMHVKTAITDAH